MSIAQGVSPGSDKTRVMNPLSLWERARVREIVAGLNSPSMTAQPGIRI